MKAFDLITDQHLLACTESTDCRHAAQLMEENNIGSLPVLDSDGKLCGILTDRDITIRLVSCARSYETLVREIMSKPVHTIRSDADIKEIEQTMERFKVRRLPVVDADDKLLGIISIADLAHSCHGLLKEHRLAEVLETVSTP